VGVKGYAFWELPPVFYANFFLEVLCFWLVVQHTAEKAIFSQNIEATIRKQPKIIFFTSKSLTCLFCFVERTLFFVGKFVESLRLVYEQAGVKRSVSKNRRL